MGRPSTVTTMRSPAAARRSTAATWLRSSRTPIEPGAPRWHPDRFVGGRRVHGLATVAPVYTRRFDVDSTPAVRSPTMNFAFSEEQEELRKVVKAFLDAKSPEAEVRKQMDTDRAATTPPSGSRWATRWACRA